MERQELLAQWIFSPFVQNLRAFLGWLLPRHQALGGHTEIRILVRKPQRQVWAAYIQPGDEDWLVSVLAPLRQDERDASGPAGNPRLGDAHIAFSLNPVHPALRRGRKLARVSSTARDTDIVAYSLFVIDVDPERTPADTAASEEERLEARLVTERIRKWLLERKVTPLLADSGNGFHLLIPLVPVTGDDIAQASRDSSTLLRVLDAQFSTGRARVDTATANPARVMKLYGTMAIKGDHTPERPHRFSSVDLRTIPEDVDLFARLALEVGTGWELAPRPAAVGAGRQVSLSQPMGVPSGQSISASEEHRRQSTAERYREWRVNALLSLPLERVYGRWLTGKRTQGGWLECRDPDSETGDRNPSASVADGNGRAERGTFYSFRTSRQVSVFDFLVERGWASTFEEACKVVADWSGVPLPCPPERPQTVANADPTEVPVPTAAAVLDGFRLAWGEAGNDAQRSAILVDALRKAQVQSVLERPGLVKAIREVTGLDDELFKAAQKEARLPARQGPPQEKRPPRVPADQRKLICWNEYGDPVAMLMQGVLGALRPTGLYFELKHALIRVEPGRGIAQVDEHSLPALLSVEAELCFMREDEDGPTVSRFDIMPTDLARAFVKSPRMVGSFARLELYTRVPLFDRRWRLVNQAGFHPQSAIYYDGPEIPLVEGTENLDKVLQGFLWKEPADRINFIGAALTALTMPHWSMGHPFVAINGDSPGVGKSTLARALAVISEGRITSTISFSPDELEMEKQLATRVDLGDRVIIVDNLKRKGEIESAILERVITEVCIAFRRLGSSTAINRQENDIILCLTMNLTQLGRDLRRRALPLNLSRKGESTELRFESDNILGDVLEARQAIVGELASMVVKWVEAGMPVPETPARHTTSQKWAATMDGILTHAGLTGFLSNYKESTQAFDSRFDMMREIAWQHAGQAPGTAAVWAGRLADGPLEERFRDGRGSLKTSRAQATIVGNLFNEYLGERLEAPTGPVRLVKRHPDGESHPPYYHFESTVS